MKVFLNGEELEDKHLDEIHIWYNVDSQLDRIYEIGSRETLQFDWIPMLLTLSITMKKDDWEIELKSKKREM